MALAPPHPAEPWRDSLAVSASSHLRSVIVRVDQIFQATDLAANALLARAQKVRELYGIANGPFI